MKIFISHSSKDKWAARRLADDLEKIGATVFLDEKDIETGQSIDSAIRKHLTESEDLLILLSPASRSSEWVLLELGGAMALGKNIVPILLYIGANDLPKAISLKLARDINEVDKYYDEVGRKLGVRVPPSAPKAKTRPPRKKSPLYSVGDRVKVVAQRPSNLYRTNSVDFTWMDKMDSYLGQSATVAKVLAKDRAYELNIDNGEYGWGHEWLVPESEE